MTALQEAVEELMGTIDSLELAIERCIPRKPLTQKEAFELMDRAPRGLFYGTDMGTAQAIWLAAKDFTERAHGIGSEE
jgi:hypothetical protein